MYKHQLAYSVPSIKLGVFYMVREDLTFGENDRIDSRSDSRTILIWGSTSLSEI